MTIKELENKLKASKVPKRYYAINGNNMPDTYVLQQVYSYWEGSLGTDTWSEFNDR